MRARLRSWWEKIKRLSVVVGIIAASILVIVMMVAIIGGYRFNWAWTGLGPYTSPIHPKDTDFQRGKTLWDWLQLLIIPLVIAVGGYLFNLAVSRNEQRNTTDNQRETALQAYIDKMSELLLDKDDPLRESKPEDEVRKIARARTLTVLSRLDKNRKRSILQFLYESGLIDRGKGPFDVSILDLAGADLSGADLSSANYKRISIREANLERANLKFTVLSGADLRQADLTKANLHAVSLEDEAELLGSILDGANLDWAWLPKANLERAHLKGASLVYTILDKANLKEADLRGADLWKASLKGADLTGAIVTAKQLDKVQSLQSAIMPDGSIHP